MTRYVAGRISGIVLNLFLVSIFLFFALRLVPGDPTLTILGDSSTDEQREQFREEEGLNKPALQQYLNWAKNALQGDFGDSFRSRSAVFDEFLRRLPVTLEVLVLSFAFTTVFGIFGGMVAATRQDSLWDYLFRFIAVLGASVPSFLLLTLMLILPARWAGYSPPFGATDLFEEPVDNLLLFVPPTLMLSIGGSAGLIRLTRTAMLDVLRQDYMRTARSKGLAGNEVILRHAFPNAFPVILTFMGLRLAFLLEGSVILEFIMGIPGLGSWALAAIQVQDYPIIMVFSLYAAAALMSISLVVDVLYAYLDPRIRYS